MSKAATDLVRPPTGTISLHDTSIFSAKFFSLSFGSATVLAGVDYISTLLAYHRQLAGMSDSQSFLHIVPTPQESSLCLKTVLFSANTINTLHTCSNVCTHTHAHHTFTDSAAPIRCFANISITDIG